MQPAHPWYRYNLATDAGILPCFTSCRRTLIQRKMRPVLVIVGDVFLHQTLQMSFVEDDHMVEQIASATPNPAFCDAILPRTSETRPRWLDTKAFHGTDHFSVKVDRSIEDQITGRGIVGKCLAQLLNHPGTVWMLGQVEMENPSPVMCNDEEAIEHAESKCRHGKEIHRGDRLSVIVQKNRPPFCGLRISRCFPHPAENGPLGDPKAKHIQFPINARGTPRWIFRTHA